MRGYITKDWTFLGYFFQGFWILIIALFALALLFGKGQQIDVLLLYVFGFFVLVAAIVPRINAWRLHRRTLALQTFVDKHHLKIEDPLKAAVYMYPMGAIDEMHGGHDRQVDNLILGDDWQYCDYTYKMYGKIKHGYYRKATVYYGIMITELPRKLPNVFFDSIKARRRQFRFQFARSQRHSLEGDFDRFFVTYFPPDYTIDSMSFISPEVMWAIRDARDYDIEIYNNHLFMYGPLFDPAKQLPDMSAKILNIKNELLHNIVTYRDQRLPYVEGRQQVAGQGISLKRSKFWSYVGAAAAAVYILYLIWQFFGFPLPQNCYVLPNNVRMCRR